MNSTETYCVTGTIQKGRNMELRIFKNLREMIVFANGIKHPSCKLQLTAIFFTFPFFLFN